MRKVNKMNGIKFTCPFCRKEQYNHELDETSVWKYPVKCAHCGKTFWLLPNMDDEKVICYFPIKGDEEEEEAC